MSGKHGAVVIADLRLIADGLADGSLLLRSSEHDFGDEVITLTVTVDRRREVQTAEEKEKTMSENQKEPQRIEASLTLNEMARAFVEYLVKMRGWPTGVRYDNTVFTPNLSGGPATFSAEIGSRIPCTVHDMRGLPVCPDCGFRPKPGAPIGVYAGDGHPEARKK